MALTMLLCYLVCNMWCFLQYLSSNGDTEPYRYCLLGFSPFGQWHRFLPYLSLLWPNVLFFIWRCCWRVYGCQKDGFAGTHGSRLLGTDCFFRFDGCGRVSVDRCHEIQNTTRFFLSNKLVRESLSVRDSNQPVSERSCHSFSKVRILTFYYFYKLI